MKSTYALTIDACFDNTHRVTSPTDILSPTALAAKLKTDGRITFAVKIIPQSASSEIVGMMSDGTLKVRVAAAPEKGRANDALTHFLAEEFGVGRHDVTIIAGHTDPRKLIRIEATA